MFRGFWSFQNIIKTLEFCRDFTDFYAISGVHCVYQMLTKIQHYRHIFLASQQNIYFSTHTKTITMAGNIFVPILKNIELEFWHKKCNLPFSEGSIMGWNLSDSRTTTTLKYA